MPTMRSAIILCTVTILLSTGCSKSQNPPTKPNGDGDNSENINATKREPVEWIEDGMEQSDSSISLGYYTDKDGTIEPVAKVARNSKPAADAMVFHSLVNAAGEVISEEIATVYETADSIYAQGKHSVANNASCSIRFRIVLAGQPAAVVKEIPVSQ
jgi:hypothetical protein